MKLSELQGTGAVVKPAGGAPLSLSALDPSKVQKAAPKPFRFAVPAAPAETREAKVARLQAEAASAAADAKAQNSPLGFAKNFGKALVENIAPSEVGLGKSIGRIFGSTKEQEKYQQQLSDENFALIRQIREGDKAGKDTTKLKTRYNSNAGELEQVSKELGVPLPSTGEVLGQLGGTALDVLSAGTYGKAAATLKTGALGKAAVIPTVVKTVAGPGRATGILSLKGLGRVGTGAGVGYASDVAMGLQGKRGEDREGAKAFIPGTGTLVGAVIPAALETERSVIDTSKRLFTKEGRNAALIAKRRAELDKLDSLQTLAKTTAKGNERGIDVKQVLAETDVLHGAVDTDGRIHTKGEDGAVAQYTKEFVDGNEAIVSEALKKEGRSIAPEIVRKKLAQSLRDSGIQGADLLNAEAKIDRELAGYARRSSDSGAIPLATLHDAKIDKYSNINFFSDGASKKYDKAIAKALKEIVEEQTTSVDVKSLNKELSKHFAVIDYLEKLDGRKVDGGKLGKYFAQTVGAIVGSHFGPLGAIAGAEAGGLVKGGSMAQTFKGKTGRVMPQAPAITAAREVIDAPPLQLPGQSNSLGSRNMSQATTRAATTIPPITAGIPDVIPLPAASVNAGGDTAANAVTRHLTEAREVLAELPPDLLAKNGGITALLDRTKTNIVDGLKAEGMLDVAEAVAAIDTAVYQSLDDYAAALAKIIGK